MPLDERPFAERLRVGIGVGPSERLRSGGAGVDELRANPLLAHLLGPDGDHVRAGRTELLAGPDGELALDGVAPRLSLEVSAHPASGGHLVTPVDRDVEPVVSEEVLLGLSLEGGGDVAGRDGDQVIRPSSSVAFGDRPGGCHRISHAAWTEEVDLHRSIEWGVEGDRSRGMDNDIAPRQLVETIGVESEPILAHVPGHSDDAACHLVGERIAELVAESVEAIVADDLLHSPIERRGPPARADGEHHG